ncbi:mitochondrial import inner membrane translocase subunit Tim17-B-like protein [Rozella allomycis CSF55]|uniref:Mitochondrial import inner membrane translocase subunit Tim17-B-like protein n=1 Tax=Rozella allomycis (strain CSF55) TaxID=988480 RepID=A0A075B1Y2_ROZAC|nr:Tim17/Tim22/Tim23/peroxisomal protein PMP24 domain-containing protein [Rozella allomycis CSF55]RKP20758.1 mitochondrial import inner membrane translocase subunit Tim17-B-like protein [Rozella allomycis CSF55]|eukprot:EPZ36578.1 Tim17/Tim22/Tim23/peroxisomal protein PMP24 domain-containing protein [Rozella allomycis CSF55]
MSQDHTRAPCPWRILEDFGGAFSMGVVGSGIWNFASGFMNAPKGKRLAGSLNAMKTHAPIRGGQFAAWGGLYSAFDCTLMQIRGKEDPWNAIMSGALAGGVIQARKGWSAILVSAFAGGLILGVIEGVGIAINRAMSGMHAPVAPMLPETAHATA